MLRIGASIGIDSTGDLFTSRCSVRELGNAAAEEEGRTAREGCSLAAHVVHTGASGVQRGNTASVKVVANGETVLKTVLEWFLPPGNLILGLAKGKRADKHSDVNTRSRQHKAEGLSGAQRRPVEVCESSGWCT